MHIELSKAYLCLDCDCIGDNSRQCAACGSHSIISMKVVAKAEKASK